MRVLVNALSARGGGGQTYLKNLFDHIPAVDEDGRPVQILLLAPASLRHLAERPSVEFLGSAAAARNGVTRPLWEYVALRRLVRRTKADVLFTPGGTCAIRPPARCKAVTMFRNMIPFDRRQRSRYPWGYQRVRNWLLERLMLRAMAAAHLVIFISDHARRVVQAHPRASIEGSVVIPHGIAARFRKEQLPLPRPQWTPRSGYFLYVSTLDFYKNQIEVVRGYMLARAAMGFAQKLLLAGPENTRYGALLRAEIARLGADEEVLLAGAVPYDDLPALYQNADLHIFASESENCPNILLEALASGRPILCSDRQPMPEFAGNAVEYFDPRCPQSLADKLAQLLADPARQDELARQALSQSLRYDWAHSARRTWDAILSLEGAGARREL